jgi:hypothetical protein
MDLSYDVYTYIDYYAMLLYSDATHKCLFVGIPRQ